MTSRPYSVLIGQITNDPLSKHQLIGSRFHRIREKLYFVLLINLSIERKVTHFAVAILDLPTGLGDVGHALLAELIELGIRA